MRVRLESLIPWLPPVGLMIWLLAGRWPEADFQARNWTLFMTAICLALLVPLTSSAAPRAPARLVVALGWVLLAGLVYFTR
jgi:hypothetical protein